MTDIEALLSVDAGRTPAGTVAFRVADPDQAARRLWAAISGVAALATLGTGIGGGGRVAVSLLGLTAAIFAVLATRTLSEDEDEERSKKPIVVITPRGVVIRDGSGLRHWQFEDLASVSTRWHMDRLLLVLVGQDGKRALVDCQRFRRGHRLPEIISRRVKPGAAQTAQA